MSHFKYYAYEGTGVTKKSQSRYSQAVRVGDRIECAGQGRSLSYSLLLSSIQIRSVFAGRLADTDSCTTGGWDPKTGVFQKEINAQIDLAFSNVELCLKDAGGKGWSQVYRVNSYHVPLNSEALEAMVRNFEKYMPGHQPIWTCVGVSRLGEDDMRVEIEVIAHDPEGAKVA